MSVMIESHDGVVGAHGLAHVGARGVVGEHDAVILTQAGDEAGEAGRQQHVEEGADEKREFDEGPPLLEEEVGQRMLEEILATEFHHQAQGVVLLEEIIVGRVSLVEFRVEQVADDAGTWRTCVGETRMYVKRIVRQDVHRVCHDLS